MSSATEAATTVQPRGEMRWSVVWRVCCSDRDAHSATRGNGICTRISRAPTACAPARRTRWCRQAGDPPPDLAVRAGEGAPRRAGGAPATGHVRTGSNRRRLRGPLDGDLPLSEAGDRSPHEPRADQLLSYTQRVTDAIRLSPSRALVFIGRSALPARDRRRAGRLEFRPSRQDSHASLRRAPSWRRAPRRACG